jgi:hypothetical protein
MKGYALFFSSGSPLCRFKRINLEYGGADFRLDMGGKITDARLPLGGWRGICAAVSHGIDLDDSITAVAFFNNRAEETTAVYIPAGGARFVRIGFLGCFLHNELLCLEIFYYSRMAWITGTKKSEARMHAYFVQWTKQ